MDESQHILVPKHEKISAEDKNKLLEKYNISFQQLPKILPSDPAIANLKAKTGDVIKITRTSPTAGTTYFYRGVMNE